MTNEDTKMTYEQFQDAMIAYAKEAQGDAYPGDEYYRQDCWSCYWEDGDEPSDAVISDMGYWDE